MRKLAFGLVGIAALVAATPAASQGVYTRALWCYARPAGVSISGLHSGGATRRRYSAAVWILRRRSAGVSNLRRRSAGVSNLRRRLAGASRPSIFSGFGRRRGRQMPLDHHPR